MLSSVGDVTQRGPHQVDDAELHLGLRIGRANRLGKAGQAVDAGHEDVVQAAILQVRQHLEPELGPFAFGQPQAEQFLLARQIHAQRHVDRVLRNTAAGAAHMHHDPVEVDDRPDRLQRPRPPGRDFLVHGVGQTGNQRRRQFHAVERFHQLLDVARAHALGVQARESCRRSRPAAARTWESAAARRCRCDRAAWSIVSRPGSPCTVLAEVPLRRLRPARLPLWRRRLRRLGRGLRGGRRFAAAVAVPRPPRAPSWLR